MQKIFWRLLLKSKIFNYWYNKFMVELLYDLDLIDIEQKELKEKYHNKYKKFINNNHKENI